MSFHSDAPVEKIEAHNYQVASILNSASGDMEFIVLIRNFVFENAMMQEHFNEDYLHSDTYPKAVFKGKIKNFEKVDLKKEGTYQVEVEGDMTIHGVTKKSTAARTIEVKKDKVKAKATFPVVLKEYNVSIPKWFRVKLLKPYRLRLICLTKSRSKDIPVFAPTIHLFLRSELTGTLEPV